MSPASYPPNTTTNADPGQQPPRVATPLPSYIPLVRPTEPSPVPTTSLVNYDLNSATPSPSSSRAASIPDIPVVPKDTPVNHIDHCAEDPPVETTDAPTVEPTDVPIVRAAPMNFSPPAHVNRQCVVNILQHIAFMAELLIPGHGQFVSNFTYLYFLQHINLDDHRAPPNSSNDNDQ